jgi:hypothetical protein
MTATHNTLNLADPHLKHHDSLTGSRMTGSLASGRTMSNTRAILVSVAQNATEITAAQTTANATLRAAETAAHYAWIGACLALGGAVLAAIVAKRNGYLQARTTQQLKHAEFRQVWINRLRDEMANYQARASEPGATDERIELGESIFTVLMLMDRNDPDYGRLAAQIRAVERLSGDAKAPNSQAALTEAKLTDHADLLGICQDILTREWEVTKAEMHETPWDWPISRWVRFRKWQRKEAEMQRRALSEAGLPISPPQPVATVGRLSLMWKRRDTI